ncbi:MAG TPA: hypothetical protein VLY23_07185 [Candidatus Acidoferrum sp.]|nr:hypothetical protein [Candidatus Acidoferrum sp.]
MEREDKSGALVRREVLLNVALSLGGLAAVFGGIEIFNFLVSWLHWH